ncbi:MAG: membrane protein insertion efficiency factor YidD [Spirochaetia bacterium]|nr:membrane protein insertion efficiency factor YidD [Spirochaetia bacterium]
MKRIFIAIIRFYQKAISPLKGNTCRFYPSCSQYALECFQNYSFFKALGKSIWRILRCQPFSKGYFDPAVPDHTHSHT